MPTYLRRTVYDLNDCYFSGRVAEEPRFMPYKKPDGSVTDMLMINMVVNSNPYSAITKTYINIHAFGKQAERFHATIHKGYGIWFKGELKDIMQKKRTMGTNRVTLTHYASFAAERIGILSIPDKEGKDIAMEIPADDDLLEEWENISQEPHPVEIN